MSKIEKTLAEVASTRPASLDSDRLAYEKLKADLCRRYPGEYVAFVDGKLAGHDPDRERLLDQLYAAHPGRRIFYKRLIEPEPFYHLPSPRRA